MTTGKYTAEALTFAQSNPLQLIDGFHFMEKIFSLPDDARQRLLHIATDGDYKVPSCPSCGIMMVFREGAQGRKSFWGCRNFPRGCRQKFFVSVNAHF